MSSLKVNDKLLMLEQIAVLEAEIAKRNSYKISRYFQDEGPLRRELYTKALEFFAGGVKYPERLLLGGNRTGKTESAAYEIVLHMTGQYPHWWNGKRFDHPVDVWAAGDTASTTRDIQQLTLYGPIPAAPRTGLIPAHLITHASNKNSIPGAVETIWVKHVSGGESSIQFKSYDQRREAFQGTAKHIVWLDEECPEDIYTECLLRTLTVEGIVIVTFTPVEGLTPFVQGWLETAVMSMADDDGNRKLEAAESMVFAGSPDDDDPDAGVAAALTTTDAAATEPVPLTDRQRLITMISWDEVPHLSPAARQQMLQSIPPYQRAARTRGIPNLGSGVIYPIPEEEIRVKPFAIPDHWPRGYGMDVGWNWTVAIWGAFDRETSTTYIYHEHYRSHAEPPVHASGIKAVGAWIPGRIDPGANGRSQVDGKQLLQLYLDLGLEIDVAPNGVEAGIYEVWTRLTGGRIRIFTSLKHTFTEYRMYRRDAKGRIVKKNDHLMDALRYLIASGHDFMKVNLLRNYNPEPRQSGGGSDDWMG